MTITAGLLAKTLVPPEAELPGARLRGRSPLPSLLRPGARLAVLDITKFFGDTTGGVRTYLLEKAAYVEDRPWLRQTLLLPGPKDALTESEGVRAYRLRGPGIPTQRPYRLMLAARSIRRIIAHERPDVIEIGSPYLVPWMVRGVARSLDVPIVWFYHADFPRLMVPRPEAAPLPARLAAAAAWRYVGALGRRVDLTVAGSAFAASDLRWAGVQRVEVVPLGVDVSLFHPERRTRRDETRRRLGLPSDTLLAAYAGRIAREKELDVVVRGWQQVHRDTGARLLLVGDGPDLRHSGDTRNPASSSHFGDSRNPVSFSHSGDSRNSAPFRLPFQRDRQAMADLLAALDLYIAPGPMETFGLSAAEALASGTPVLSVDQGAVPEQITASGAGALYRRGDPDSFARAATGLLRAGRDALDELGRLGRSYSETHHRWDVVFDRLFAIYDNL